MNETGGRVALTKREREILGALAEGMSGAQIAEQLVLSPETVRTHVRNAMSKLGASTRSQAVALALQNGEITTDATATAMSVPVPPPKSGSGDPTAGLATMLAGLVSLYDVDGGAVYLTDEDGLSLRRVSAAERGPTPIELAQEIALGEGPLGRTALERRAQLVRGGGGDGTGRGALMTAPMIGGGNVLGVIALVARASRPIGRSEMLLLQAFSNRVGEILQTGGEDVGSRLERAMQRFQASWSG